MLEVLLAPLVLVAWSLICHWWALLVGALAYGFCILVGPEEPESLWPSTETLLLTAGTLLCIMVAAIPLAVRDYVVPSEELAWKPDKECLECGSQFAERLLACNLQDALKLLEDASPQSRARLHHLASFLRSAEDYHGALPVVQSVTEVPLESYEHFTLGSAIVNVRMSSPVTSSTNLPSIHLLCLQLQRIDNEYLIREYCCCKPCGEATVVTITVVSKE